MRRYAQSLLGNPRIPEMQSEVIVRPVDLAEAARAQEATGTTNATDAARSLPVGAYLTNETFLYRVLGVISSDQGDVVELEDCFQLGAVRVPVATASLGQLRRVTPGAESP